MTQVHLNGKRMKRLCKYCNNEFQLYDEFKTHIESHQGIFICVICGEYFRDSQALSSHAEDHKKIDVKLRKYVCDYCGHRLFNKIQLNVMTYSCCY